MHSPSADNPEEKFELLNVGIVQWNHDAAFCSLSSQGRLAPPIIIVIIKVIIVDIIFSSQGCGGGFLKAFFRCVILNFEGTFSCLWLLLLQLMLYL